MRNLTHGRQSNRQQNMQTDNVVKNVSHGSQLANIDGWNVVCVEALLREKFDNKY